MSNHRFSNGKNYYQPNKYKANLMHQRAMRAGQQEEKPVKPKNTSDRFLSSRRDDQIKQKPISQTRPYNYKRGLTFGVDNFDVVDDSLIVTPKPAPKAVEPVLEPELPKEPVKSEYKPARFIEEKTIEPDFTPQLPDEPVKAEYYKPARFADEKPAFEPVYSSNESSNTTEAPRTSHFAPNRFKKPDRSKIAIIAVASVLVVAVISFVIWCVIDATSRQAVSSTDYTEYYVKPTYTEPATEVNPFTPAVVTDDNSVGEYENDLYIWSNSVFETFTLNENSATAYAQAINSYAEELGSGIKTYAMIIPSHIEMGLPQRLIDSGDVTTDSQADFISSAYSQLSQSVTAVNCYNAISSHNNEYIYFTTENYWTALGAYYGYTAFMETTAQTALDLNTCTENKIDEFYGQLTQQVEKELPPDTVSYYDLPYDTINNIYYESDGTYSEKPIYNEDATRGRETYEVFLWGDFPVNVLKTNNGNGKKIAVVKDPNGNCFAPYLTYNYDEVHVIDYMLYAGSLKEYCDENGITEVLFINGANTANSERHINAIGTLFNTVETETVEEETTETESYEEE